MPCHSYGSVTVYVMICPLSPWFYIHGLRVSDWYSAATPKWALAMLCSELFGQDAGVNERSVAFDLMELLIAFLLLSKHTISWLYPVPHLPKMIILVMEALILYGVTTMTVTHHGPSRTWSL